MLLFLCAAVLALLSLAPDLPLSRRLHTLLVAEPVRRLAGLSRQRILFGVVLLMLFAAGAEMIALIGSAEIAMTIAWQISLYLDAVTASIGAALLAKARPLTLWLRAQCGRVARRSPRARRLPHRPAPSAGANDDDPAPALLAA